MKKLLGLILLLPSLSYASYVNSCLLDVVVTEPTSTLIKYATDGLKEVEISELTVSFVVKKARPNGRADSGCKTFIGESKTVTLEQAPRIQLFKGDRIQLEYFMIDGENYSRLTSYRIINNKSEK